MTVKVKVGGITHEIFSSYEYGPRYAWKMAHWKLRWTKRYGVFRPGTPFILEVSRE